MKIKTGDNVIVIAGKDKGRIARVTRLFPRGNLALVDGVNIKKKHQKPRKSGQKGQVIERAEPVHISNLMLIDPKSGRRARIGYKFMKGKKVRVAKKSGAVL